MSNEGKLEIIVSADAVWAEAAALVLDWGFTDGEQIQYHGQMVANAAALGHIGVVDLRTRVSALSCLDREAVELNGEWGGVLGDGLNVLEGVDLAEGIARRLAHGAGRFGLNQVRSRERLQTCLTGYRQRQQLLRTQAGSGMFQLERRDLNLETLVLADYAGKLKERE